MKWREKEKWTWKLIFLKMWNFQIWQHCKFKLKWQEKEEWTWKWNFFLKRDIFKFGNTVIFQNNWREKRDGPAFFERPTWTIWATSEYFATGFCCWLAFPFSVNGLRSKVFGGSIGLITFPSFEYRLTDKINFLSEKFNF